MTTVNAFVEAVVNQSARTTNGMLARASSASAIVDLFYGATRGADIVPLFVAAYVEDQELALRVLQWIRDVRGGSGERQLFRNVLLHMEQYYPHDALRLIPKIPTIGRWDDLLIFMTPRLVDAAYAQIKIALDDRNGLCAKWLPRKGPLAAQLQRYLGLTPRAYRKTLVGLTAVVETPMCSGQWESIDYSTVPSLAHARYKTAFARHSPTRYGDYAAALVRGEPSVKINAGAVYPHDVLRGHTGSWGAALDDTQVAVIEAQWRALPDYARDASVLPIIDVSGSMSCPASGDRSGLTCLDVAVALGLYFADRGRGPFRDTFMTFSAQPQLVHLRGSITEKIAQINRSDWDMNTDLVAALDRILEVALAGRVPQSDMPRTLLLLSDMQFDQAIEHDESAMDAIRRRWVDAGYTPPGVVFWNINAYGTVPVKFDERGVVLVSGYSPAIAGSVLSGDLHAMTPLHLVRRTVEIPRYDL